jgi:hypothetical protein
VEEKDILGKVFLRVFPLKSIKLFS